jgi:hypothetical protein
MKKIVPVPVMCSESGQSLPIPNFKRRPHLLAFDRAHVVASGPRRSSERDACFPAMGVFAKAAMWCAYL